MNARGDGRSSSFVYRPGKRFLSDLVEPVRGIEGGDLVGVGEGRVVEDRVDEVVDGETPRHRRLADVDELRGGGPEDVNAFEGARVGVDQQLQQPGVVASDLPACELP